MTKAIMVDIERCLACKSCEIACALAHSQAKVLEEAIAESPKPHRRVTVEAAEGFAVPLQCRHCEDAPCIAVCPTGAIHRKSGDEPVLIEQEKCIGCKFCLMACPFGVISISADGKAMIKCDLCIDRLEMGQEPACVEACPTKALKLGSEKEYAAGKRRRAAEEIAASAQKDSTKKRGKGSRK